MTLPVFPTLRGLGWSIKKTPMLSTTVASHASGREVRVRNWVQPLYSFELVFNALASNAAYPGIERHSLQMLMGLFNDVGGQAGKFLYTDPTDTRQTGVPLGVGDGATISFPFMRSLFNAPAEPVGYVSYVSAVYANGAAQVGNWSFANPYPSSPVPTLSFTSAPAAGVAISADFNWQFVCRFSADTMEFEQIMADLWQITSCKFQSVRNGGF